LVGSNTAASGGSSGAVVVASSSRSSASGARAWASIGGSERNGNIETRFVGSLDVGSKALKGLVTGGRGVDGPVHAALAVRDATTEEPDGGRWVDNLQRVYTDLARGVHEGKEAGVKALLIGGSIELPCTWVGKAALGNSVVTTSELEVDDVSLVRGNLRRIKPETNCAVLASTDEDGDVGGRDEGRRESGNGEHKGSGELHGVER